MYSVSEEYSKAITADTRDMPYRVKLAGAITLEQNRIPKMTLTESASGSSGISIGTSNSASLTLTIRKADTIDYDDIFVEPESGLVLPDGSIEWIPLGKFWVTSFSTSNDYETVSLNCADGMYHMTGDYESKLTYPIDVKKVVEEICSFTGVEFKDINSLPDITVRKKPDKMTYREAIGYAAGCCGKNARFDRDGKLEFFWYKDTGITIERKTQYLNGMTKLNDKPLDVNFDVVGKEEFYNVNVVSDGNGVVTASPGTNVLEGDIVEVSINPSSGYELADISATTDNGENVTLLEISANKYKFVQPYYDVTVTVSFRQTEADSFSLTLRAYDGGNIRSSRYTYSQYEIVTVYIKADDGYKFDKYETIPANVYLSETGTNNAGETVYEFTMPQSDVTIDVYFVDVDVDVEEEPDDESKTGLYSWLALPAHSTPPTSKPYWAVFYEHTFRNPTSTRFYLVWFDSWSATSYGSDGYGKTLYNITFDGYYFCGSKDMGHYPQAWDTDSWSGNGASGSTLKWRSIVGEMWAADATGTGSGGMCLIASNVSLYKGNEMLFQKCKSAIQFPRVGYVEDGMDVREKGALSYYKCPDTFGSRVAGKNWMILNTYGFLMKKNTDGTYGTTGISSNELLVVWFDSIAVENVGNVLEATGEDEDFYIATVTNGYYTKLVREGENWGTLNQIIDGRFIGLRNPLISEEYVYGSVATGSYRFSGLMVSSCDISGSGTFLRYKNDCKICDCASAASTFSLRRTASAVASNTKEVSLTYSNPFIYEKTVDSVKNLIQNVTYTPAKVKHRGNPAFQVGDIVTVPDKDGVYHSVPIMQQTFNFGGGMNSEITAPGKTEKQTSFSANGPISTQIRQKVNEINERIGLFEANAEHLYASFSDKISGVYTKLGEFEVTAEHLNATFSEKVGEINERMGEFEVTAEGLSADFYEKVDEINTKMGSFEVTAEGLNASFAEKVDEINERMGRFELTAGGLTTEFAEKVDEINTKMSEIEATAGKISFSVYESLGSRNLIKGTKTPTEVISDGYYETYTNAKFEPTVPLEYGETYTFSADVEIINGVADGKIDISIVNDSYSEEFITLDIVDGHVSGQITISIENPSYLCVYAGEHGKTGMNSVTFSNIKFEKGDTATDWSPAPEDFGYYATEEYVSSQILITANSIVSSVSDEFNRIDGELSLKIDDKNLVSVLNTSTDVIQFWSNNFSLRSDNLQIDADGSIMSTQAQFGQWSLGGYNIVGKDENDTSKEVHLTPTELLSFGVYGEYFSGVGWSDIIRATNTVNSGITDSYTIKTSNGDLRFNFTKGILTKVE